MAKMHPGFTLSELIQTTADELRKAAKNAPQGDKVMQFKGCELELAVTLGGEGGAGIRFWLVDVSSKAKAETVSKIKLSFGSLDNNNLGFSAIGTDPEGSDPHKLNQD